MSFDSVSNFKKPKRVNSIKKEWNKLKVSNKAFFSMVMVEIVNIDSCDYKDVVFNYFKTTVNHMKSVGVEGIDSVLKLALFVIGKDFNEKVESIIRKWYSEI